MDTAHVLVQAQDTRQNLYVAASRARLRTALYAVTEDDRPELPARNLIPERCSVRS